MLDKIIGLAAILMLVGFMGILIGFVPVPDLVIIIVIVVAMAVYDFYLSIFKRRDGA